MRRVFCNVLVFYLAGGGILMGEVPRSGIQDMKTFIFPCRSIILHVVNSTSCLIC